MPKLPMPPTIEESYNANTTAQYEALGRFVEAFEAMVNETRNTSIKILRRDDEHERLVEIAFHHSSLSAKPLFEIMRALIADFLKQPYLRELVTIQDRDTFSGVLAEIATHYFDLVSKRNSLLHGTWRVGFITFDDASAENFFLDKYKPTKTGLLKEELPKHAFELLALRDRCSRVRNWLGFIDGCLPLANQPFAIAKTFQFKDGRWNLTFKDTKPETLP
jgi:hypothetical protein